MNGVHLKIKPRGQPFNDFVICDRWLNGGQAISDTSNHEGIEFNGLVYDNLGDPLPRRAWLATFHYAEATTLVDTYDFVVTEIPF